MRHRIAVFVLLLGALALWARIAPAPIAQAAATIIVDTGVDADPPNAADGFCSLREAVINANDDAATFPECAAGDGDDTIIIDLAFDTITLVIGLPDNTGVLTIQAEEGAVFSISGAATSHLIDNPAGSTLTLKNLFITSTLRATNGGAIVNGGILNVDSVIFSDSETSGDGGVIYNTGTLNADDTVFDSPDAAVNGGAISNDGGNITITDSYFISTSAIGAGGAIENSGSTSSAMIINTVFEDGAANFGGSIYNEGTLIVKEGAFVDIFLGDPTQGGAIYNTAGATLEVRDSLFEDLIADQGGAIYLDGTLIPQTGRSVAGGTIVISGSSFVDTIAINGDAIYSSSAVGVILANNTFSTFGNDATVEINGGTADIYNSTFAFSSVGVRATNASVILNHTTISLNSINGIVVDTGATVTAYNSILDSDGTTDACLLVGGACWSMAAATSPVMLPVG